jgi:hypothetical protein
MQHPSSFWPTEMSMRPPVSIARTTTTDVQGDFTFAPLPPGEYTIEPREVAADLSTARRYDPPPEKHPLPAYFAPQKVVLAEDKDPQPLEIHATPTVLVSGQVKIPQSLLDAMREQSEVRAQRFGPGGGRGVSAESATVARGLVPSQPEATDDAAVNARLLQSFAPQFHGTINGIGFSARCELDREGNFAFTVPRGLMDGIVRLPTTATLFRDVFTDASRGRSTPPQPKWRTDKDKPLVGGEEVSIGKVNADIRGIEVVYPDPPKPGPAAAFPGGPRPGGRARAPAGPIDTK